MFFDPDTVKDDDFEKIPDGSYRLLVDNSEVKPLKSGKGRGVSIRFVVADGQHKGRKIFANFNIEHENQMAANIGKRQLRDFLAAIGHTEKLQYENDLHRIVANKVVYGELVSEPGNDGRVYQKVEKFHTSERQGRAAPVQVSQAANDLDKDPF